MRFRKKRSGAVSADVDRVEAEVLAAVVTDLLALLGEDEAEHTDPLAAMVGIADGPLETPEDPALARLLPDAHREDPEASQEFRRYTESDLRAGKRGSATVVLAGLAPLVGTGGTLVLDRDEADAWLGTLNDLRLVLGTRLEVTEDTELDPRPDDPRAQALQVYSWLGWLQESLLHVLVPR